MANEYWVLHYGAGTDGGFGDWSPPYWSDEPLELGGEVVWFRTQEEAELAAVELSDRSREVFYAHGEHCTYDGEFPVEYEARRMFTPDSGASTVQSVVDQAANDLHEFWIAADAYDDEDAA